MSSLLSIKESVNLQDKNSLRIAVNARYFVSVTSLAELKQALDYASEHELDTLVLGGGSNLVFAGDFPGLVIEVAIRGRRWKDIDGDEATLELGGGECWHDCVLYAARSGYRGIENLALIPGTVGAAPVQNIGAYGRELKDTLVSVTALDRQTGEEVVLSCSDCQFSYRDSLFKRDPSRYVIVRVCLRLSRGLPFALGYQDLANYFSGENTSDLTPMDVAEAVMAVRRRKLPEPSVLPNAGSFFKNPVVSVSEWERLKAEHGDVAGYPSEESAKVAAAWLIDRCGWKGFRNDRVGVHNRQALVLVNHSNGSGADILRLAERIKKDVLTRFGIELEMEPGIVGGAD